MQCPGLSYPNIQVGLKSGSEHLLLEILSFTVEPRGLVSPGLHNADTKTLVQKKVSSTDQVALMCGLQAFPPPNIK